MLLEKENDASHSGANFESQLHVCEQLSAGGLQKLNGISIGFSESSIFPMIGS